MPGSISMMSIQCSSLDFKILKANSYFALI
jgi:hypothetical protein